MRALAAAILVGLGAASCADDTTVNPVRGPAFGFASGTRLRARVRSLEGDARAARMFAGWFDTRLDTKCAFASAEDGALRCVPVADEIVVAFTDAACTDALALRDPSCAPVPAFAGIAVAGDGCDSVGRAFRVGARREAPEALYVASGAACVRVSPPSGAEAYALDTLAPTELVRARLDHEATTPRLGVEVLVADDGARQARRIVDADRGPCFSIAGVVGGGEDHCVPEAVAWATYAGDAACKVPLAYQVRRSPTCPRADVVVSYAPDGCTVKTRFYARGDDVKLDDVYVGPPPVCTPLRQQPDLFKQLSLDHVFYGVGGALDGDALAPMGTTTVGDGRLALLVLSDGAGTPLLPARSDTMYDAALGAPCRVTRFADGVARCVPTDAATIVTPAFADAACTREIVSVAPKPDCASAPMPTVALRATSDACSGAVFATGAVRLGGRLALDSYYTNEGGACTPQPASGAFLEVTGDLSGDALPRVAEGAE